ncbi:HNH endonuclease [Salinarimonas sp. NSM]|uniref:HNH endonuclease n=1 Tax=Salinarimonas sp. NSM TaxID=3458003 RepID=UPI0040359B46
MPQRAKPAPIKHCRACGAQMDRKRINGRLEDLSAFRNRVYCDRACMARGMEKDVCRSLSHSRSKAAAQAKPACEACGATGKLHVHHRDEDPTNNTPSNLRTLCPACHRRSHSPNFMEDGVTPKPCEHCARPSVKRGLCGTHLSRLKRHGHPLAVKRKRGSQWVLEISGDG